MVGGKGHSNNAGGSSKFPSIDKLTTQNTKHQRCPTKPRNVGPKCFLTTATWQNQDPLIFQLSILSALSVSHFFPLLLASLPFHAWMLFLPCTLRERERPSRLSLSKKDWIFVRTSKIDIVNRGKSVS